jgi:hypothetical protein
MKQYHKNPRTITKAELTELRDNIRELGDLSGITHDLNTDEVITGNQRSKIIDINSCEKEIIEEYPEPSPEGTIAWGYIIWEGQRLNYRQVRWNDEQRKRACITANKLGGKFDYQILEKDFDPDKLKQWGFKDDELQGFDVLGDLLEGDSFSGFVKTSRDEFAMTFLIPKAQKYAMEKYLRKHTKKELAEKIIKFISDERIQG